MLTIKISGRPGIGSGNLHAQVETDDGGIALDVIGPSAVVMSAVQGYLEGIKLHAA